MSSTIKPFSFFYVVNHSALMNFRISHQCMDSTKGFIIKHEISPPVFWFQRWYNQYDLTPNYCLALLVDMSQQANNESFNGYRAHVCTPLISITD